jgi:Rieske 2Fe-2S family protein
MNVNATRSRVAAVKNPYPVTESTRIPSARYHDQTFYDLECERLWPRVWQMACRLEEIPKPGDYVEYENLDQSIIVVRVDENTVKAYHNHCRHRGMKLVMGTGTVRQGFSCPFHGWRFNLDGDCTFIYQKDLFPEADRDPADLRLRPCRVETWGGCAFINLDDNAAPLVESLEPFSSYHEARGASKMRMVWWRSTVVPVNWKLAMEAFMEGYHVMRTHPQILPASANRGPDAVYRPVGSKIMGSTTQAALQSGAVDSAQLIENSIHFIRTLSEGMDGGMVMPKDIEVAESLRGTQLPGTAAEAAKEWNRVFNEALTERYRAQGMPMHDLNELEKSRGQSVQFGFPNYFLLPMYGNMASYRIRPLGPESTLFEIWALTLYPEGKEPPSPKKPVPIPCDSEEFPPIPKQDFANLPHQQKGLRTKGFEFMRLSNEVEGLISNFHRVVDGYLDGAEYQKLVPAMQQVSGGIDSPIKAINL